MLRFYRADSKAQDRCRDGTVLFFLALEVIAGARPQIDRPPHIQLSEIRQAAEIAAGLLNRAGLPGCGEIDLMDEPLEEDRLGDSALCDLVCAAGVDDGDIGDPNEAEDDAEVGAFRVVGLHG